MVKMIQKCPGPSHVTPLAGAAFASLRDPQGKLAPMGFALQFTAGANTALAGAVGTPGAIPDFCQPGAGTAFFGAMRGTDVGNSIQSLSIEVQEASAGSDSRFVIALCGPQPFAESGRLAPGTYQILGDRFSVGTPAFGIGARTDGAWAYTQSSRGTFTVHEVAWGGELGTQLDKLHVTWDLTTGRHHPVDDRITGTFVYER